MEESPAFTNTGVDFAGPLFVKSDLKEKSDMKKVYIALYTCGSSRAVHLDVVPDLSAETFIRSFKRFICRKGMPRLVVSDNAKTFKTSARVLTSIFGLPEVQSFYGTTRLIGDLIWRGPHGGAASLNVWFVA